MKKKNLCCFCGSGFDGIGNNPAPVDTRNNARCCDMCNANIVLPARLTIIRENDTETEGVCQQ